jgi:hypothetical protein
MPAKNAPVAQLDRALDYESRGQEFESLRARHFGTKLGTPKPAVFAPGAATSVRKNTLLAPMMRTFFVSTSTRWASARLQISRESSIVFAIIVLFLFVPNKGSRKSHSITSLACASTVAGTSTPSAFSVREVFA